MFQYFPKYPGVAIAYAISVASPLVAWLVALYLTRNHYGARLRFRRTTAWVVVFFYCVWGIALCIELFWPPWPFGRAWFALALFESFLLGTAISLSGFLVQRARKASTSDFSHSCPGCGYSLTGSTSARCPECGRPLSEEGEGGG